MTLRLSTGKRFESPERFARWLGYSSAAAVKVMLKKGLDADAILEHVAQNPPDGVTSNVVTLEDGGRFRVVMRGAICIQALRLDTDGNPIPVQGPRRVDRKPFVPPHAIAVTLKDGTTYPSVREFARACGYTSNAAVVAHVNRGRSWDEIAAMRRRKHRSAGVA